MHFDRLEGEPEFKKAAPESIQEFRKLAPDEKIHLPELAENRKLTNFAFIVVFVLCIIGWIIFGVYLKVSKDTFKGAHKDFENNSQFFTFVDHSLGIACGAVTGFAILASILVFVLYRYKTRCAIISFLVICFLKSVAVNVYLWYIAVTILSINTFAQAILNLIVLLAIVGIAWFLRKKFELVVRVVHEALIAMFFSPLILALPILTFILDMVIWMTSFYFLYCFIQDGYSVPIVLAYFFTTVFFIYWTTYFLSGCQVMIVAGTIAAYYFARDKSTLVRPFARSFGITLRYHLGTLAAGSLIIAIISFLRTLANSARDSQSTNICVCVCICFLQCLLFCLEEIANYLTRKAYIMTAIHGKGLCTSGMRGIRLLWYFSLDTIGVELFSGLAISGAIVTVFTASIAIGVAILYKASKKIFENRDHNKILLWVILILLILVILTTLLYYYGSLLSVSIETIYLCLCEDKRMNDGSRERPYFMSKELAEVAVIFSELVKEEHEKRLLKQEQLEQRRASRGQN